MDFHRRPRQVELAIGGADLLGVRDSFFGLRPEIGLRQHVLDQLGRDLGSTREHGARIVVRAELESLLRRDRAGIELLDRLVDRDAGLRVAGHDRPLDRRRPAPARQQRGVHVEPERLPEQALRNQQAVGRDHDRIQVTAV